MGRKLIFNNSYLLKLIFTQYEPLPEDILGKKTSINAFYKSRIQRLYSTGSSLSHENAYESFLTKVTNIDDWVKILTHCRIDTLCRNNLKAKHLAVSFDFKNTQYYSHRHRFKDSKQILGIEI